MNSPLDPKNILVVDDEPSVRCAISLLLNCGGYLVEAVSNAENALSCLRSGRYDLLMTDNVMPGMSGLDLASEAKVRAPGMPVIMHTAYPPARKPDYLDLVLVKPEGASHLLQSVDRFLQPDAA